MQRCEYRLMASGGQFSRSTLIYGGARTSSAEYALSRRSGEHGAGEKPLCKYPPFAESRNAKDNSRKVSGAPKNKQTPLALKQHQRRKEVKVPPLKIIPLKKARTQQTLRKKGRRRKTFLWFFLFFRKERTRHPSVTPSITPQISRRKFAAAFRPTSVTSA